MIQNQYNNQAMVKFDDNAGQQSPTNSTFNKSVAAAESQLLRSPGIKQNLNQDLDDMLANQRYKEPINKNRPIANQEAERNTEMPSFPTQSFELNQKLIKEERQSPAASRYKNNNTISNEVINNSKKASTVEGLDDSLEQINLTKRKVGSGDEMPQMPTMSMRAA